MKLPCYFVNAFTDKLFTGNPAAVCLLPHGLPEETLRKIAIENNLPVTVFLVKEENHYAIRWITPDYELYLCGHGTLAASYVIFNYITPSLSQIELRSKETSILVTRNDPWITFAFAKKELAPIEPSALLQKALGATIHSVYEHKNERLLIVLDDEKTIKNLNPDLQALKQLTHNGLTVTARGTDVDFVSRTFYPKKSIHTEDAVTGAAHCMLAPFWEKQLQKSSLTAKQISARGGFLKCEVTAETVLLSSQAILYLEGSIVF